MNVNKLNVGLVQQTCTASREDNLARTVTGIREAVSKGAKLVVCQELHTSLYFCQTEDTTSFDLAETIPGPTTNELGKLAKELGIVIVASLFEHRAARVYHNTAVVLDTNGEIAGKYRKMHIPEDPGYYEKFYFTPGDLGFKPVQTSLGKIGVLVCWDQWFPEAARLMALAGADMLVYPTAIGWVPEDDANEKQRQLNAWQTIQRAHAIANGIPVIVCNRTGHETDPSGHSSGIDFWGNSFVAGPQGEFLIQADAKSETVLTTEIDFKHCEATRRIWPFLRDRRIDDYNQLNQRMIDE
ncbi:MAG: carbon-nitrogen hydrolase [Gammaproteobacteria bacterium]|nr:carbon-nitrogen hydrolase [Gammaproteobacteria bacterium]